MISLQGLLTSADLSSVRDKTKIMFKDASKFVTPEAVIVYEQNMLPNDVLLRACSEEYKKQLYTPKREYIPREIVDKFKGTNSTLKLVHS